MNSSKGLTSVVATVLLLLITMAAAGGLYVTMENAQKATKEIAGDYKIDVSSLDHQTCWKGDYGSTNFQFRNTGDKAMNASRLNVFMNGGVLPNNSFSISKEIVDPQQTFSVKIDIPAGPVDDFKFAGGNHDYTRSCFQYTNFDNENVDDFEDGDLSEYSDNGNAPNGFRTSSAQAFQGGYSLRTNTSDGSSEVVNITSSAGLDNYPSRGGNLTTKVYFEEGGGDANIIFGQQASDQFYAVEIDEENTRIRLLKNGFSSSLDTQGVSIPTNQWLRMKVEWGTTVTGTLYNTRGEQLATVSASDSSYSNGGIGFRTFSATGDSTETVVFYDDLDYSN